MPDAPYQYCREPGCSVRTRSAYCPEHTGNNLAKRGRDETDYERKKNDPIWKRYHCAAWFRFKISFFSCNPMCQRIEDGKQCRCPATLIHHILSPRKRPDLMYSYENCKALCAAHHTPTEGEPVENLDRLDEVYVPTRLPKWNF